MTAKVNKKTHLHKGKIFDFFKENVTLDNGVTTDFEIIRHPGAAAIVPAFQTDRIILIKQYRHAVGDFIWEIPAGTLDANETPLECAKRELKEETGFSSDMWHELGKITPLPAYSDECIHIFIAANLVKSEQNLDKDEILEVHEIKVPDALQMIYRGDIKDAKTIAGLFMATLWMKNRAMGAKGI